MNKLLEKMKTILFSKSKYNEAKIMKLTIDEKPFIYPLGAKARDTLTGFEGIIVYRTQWITNCNVYGLKPVGLTEDKKTFDSEQFDEPRIEIIEEKVIEESRATGGPSDSMVQTNKV